MENFAPGDLIKIQYPDAWEGHAAVILKRGIDNEACKVWTVLGFGWVSNRDMKFLEAT